MKWVQRIFDFYLDASIHVALAVFALIHCTVLILNIPLHHHLAYFVFFGSISCYNFVKYGVEAEKYILLANRYHKNIQFFSLICLGFSLYHSCFLNRETWIGIGILLFLTGLYALPVLPRAKNLRSWGGLKIFIVALVWAGVTVILPVTAITKILSWDVWIEAAQRFFLVLVLLVPFEIRDLKYDTPEIKTLPQRYGTASTKMLGFLTLLPFFFLTLLKDDLGEFELVTKGILVVCLGILMAITKREQSNYFASFWVEGVPIFWWGILALFVGYI